MSGSVQKRNKKESQVIARETAVVDLINSAASLMRRFRTEAKISQIEMAKLLGVTQPRVAQLESGRPDNAPSLDQIAEYAFLLGRSVTLLDRSQIEDSNLGESIRRISELEKENRKLKDEISAKDAEVKERMERTKRYVLRGGKRRFEHAYNKVLAKNAKVYRKSKQAAVLDMNQEVSSSKLRRLAHSIEDSAKGAKLTGLDVLTIVSQEIAK